MARTNFSAPGGSGVFCSAAKAGVNSWTASIVEELCEMMVAADLQREHWHRESVVLANSFGAYLLLHALAQRDGRAAAAGRASRQRSPNAARAQRCRGGGGSTPGQILNSQYSKCRCSISNIQYA